MMEDEFTTAYKTVSSLKTTKGIALADMISGVYDLLATIKLPAKSRIYLLDHLADTE